jgi:hypothetical protein
MRSSNNRKPKCPIRQIALMLDRAKSGLPRPGKRTETTLYQWLQDQIRTFAHQDLVQQLRNLRPDWWTGPKRDQSPKQSLSPNLPEHANQSLRLKSQNPLPSLSARLAPSLSAIVAMSRRWSPRG